MEPEYDEDRPITVDTRTVGLEGTGKVAAHLPAQGMVLKYDLEGEYIAIGCKNSALLLYSLAEKAIIERVIDVRDNPITSLRWRPSGEGKAKILVAADSGGHVSFWHVPSMKSVFTLRENDNSVHTIDFTRSGTCFATAGKDCSVRVYDDGTKSVAHEFKPADWNNLGHANRIFALKWVDEHVLLSGGWDSVVHFWDTRVKRSVRHFFGPNISGESLDFQDGRILAGCYAATNQIQIWDFGTSKKLQQLDWTGDVDHAEYVYTASFSRQDPSFLGAASTGPRSELRLFHLDGNGKLSQAASISKLWQGCYSLDFCPRREQISFTTPHHGFYTYDYLLK